MLDRECIENVMCTEWNGRRLVSWVVDHWWEWCCV